MKEIYLGLFYHRIKETISPDQTPPAPILGHIAIYIFKVWIIDFIMLPRIFVDKNGIAINLIHLCQCPNQLFGIGLKTPRIANLHPQCIYSNMHCKTLYQIPHTNLYLIFTHKKVPSLTFLPIKVKKT